MLFRGCSTKPDIQDKNGLTALMMAASNNNPKIVKALLDAGAAPNIKDKNGQTALDWATRKNNAEAAKLLFEAGAASGIQDTVSAETGSGGRAQIGERLNGSNAKRSPRPKHSSTELITAARNNNTKRVKELLKSRANPDLQDESGNTALIWAAYRNNTEAVRTLLNAGADTDIQSKDGCTALFWANYNNNAEMANMLRAGSSRELIDAAHNNNTGQVKPSLAAAIDSSIQDEKGRNALMVAAHDGHAEVVKALLKSGIDLDAQDKDGSTALILAAYKNNTECVRLLLEAGAAPSIQNKGGCTALFWANYNNNGEIAKMLRAGSKSNVHENNRNGCKTASTDVSSNNGIEASDLSSEHSLSAVTADTLPIDLKEEIRSFFVYIDQLLDNLPEEKIHEFARSKHFEVYRKLFEDLGIS